MVQREWQLGGRQLTCARVTHHEQLISTHMAQLPCMTTWLYGTAGTYWCKMRQDDGCFHVFLLAVHEVMELQVPAVALTRRISSPWYNAYRHVSVVQCC